MGVRFPSPALAAGGAYGSPTLPAARGRPPVSPGARHLDCSPLRRAGAHVHQYASACHGSSDTVHSPIMRRTSARPLGASGLAAARRSSIQASSRCSLRQASSRSGASVPRTAQPGSESCAQSAKRQPAASASTSSNAAPSHRPASRIPGVSIRNAPLGSVSNSRVTVVWRPRPSARTSPVAWRSSPSSALTSVDLPAPDGPSRTAVVPGASSDCVPRRRPSGPRSRRSRPARAGAPAPRPSRRRPRRGRPWSAAAQPARRRPRPARRTAPAGARSAPAAARRPARGRRWRPAPAARGAAGGAARDGALARDDAGDRAGGVERHVVAGHGRDGEPAARRYQQRAIGGAHEPHPAMLSEHAGAHVRT